MARIAGLHVRRETLFLVAADITLMIAGVLFVLRMQEFLVGPADPYVTLARLVKRLVLLILLCELALHYKGLYDLHVARRRLETLAHVSQAFGLAYLALALICYWQPRLSLGRATSIASALVVFVVLLGWRLLYEGSGRFMGKRENILVVGTGSAGVTLVREILNRPGLNLKVVGFLDEKGENIGKSLVNPCIIGGLDEMESIVAREKIDLVVLALQERRGVTPLRQLLRFKFQGIAVEDTHSLYEKLTGRILIERLSPSWLIFSDGFQRPPLVQLSKRLGDIIISFFAWLLCIPLTVLIALAIYLETGAPVLFSQERVGFRGKPFRILKFRSMYQNAEANGPSWAVPDDKRITRVGRLIRRYRLDEIPQLFNVLWGDMSMVGPRPERAHFCEILAESLPLFSERQSVRPGITGWAQIRYKYGWTSDDAKVKLEFDLFYIKNFSLMMDLAILLETVKVVLLGRGAH